MDMSLSEQVWGAEQQGSRSSCGGKGRARTSGALGRQQFHRLMEGAGAYLFQTPYGR